MGKSGDHTCGVRTDGTLACWGFNFYGQATPPAGTFTQVSAGYSWTCGVRTNGTLACWGRNNYGEATPPAGAFTQVSAGWAHTCGLKTDGTVACWGENHAGQATPPPGTFGPEIPLSPVPLAFEFPWGTGPGSNGDGTGGQGWVYLKGPHPTGRQGGFDALDFNPFPETAPCTDAQRSGDVDPQTQTAWVRPTAPGIVTFVGSHVATDHGTNGQLFILHGTGTALETFAPNGWLTRFEHLAEAQVTVGQSVNRSNILGHPSCLISNGGSASHPHIHIGIWRCTQTATQCTTAAQQSASSALFKSNWYPVSLGSDDISFCRFRLYKNTSWTPLDHPSRADVSPGGGRIAGSSTATSLAP